MDLPHVVSEIFNVEKYCDLEIPVESIKVIESGTIRYTGYGHREHHCVRGPSHWRTEQARVKYDQARRPPTLLAG